MLDPLSPAVRDGHVTLLAGTGQLSEAWRELAAAEQLWPGATSLAQARFRLHMRYGNPREAPRLLRSGVTETRGARIFEPFLLTRIDPTSAKIDALLRLGRQQVQEDARMVLGHSQALAEFDRTEELKDLLLRWPHKDVSDHITDVLFRPSFADLHRDPAFMRIAQHLGLLRYWRTSGKWPDFCRTPAFAYDCKAEAARLSA